jgi:hypothetical protein
VAAISGDKFENGAVTGAFSYAFNDYLHRPPPQDRIDEDFTIEAVAGVAVGAYAVAEAGFSAVASWWLSEGAAEGGLTAAEQLEINRAAGEF